ncbi:MAG: YibE/F family protein [Spirochaetes bacterium]|nr:YibE/F family protein [Spirochaetota bacterium]
MKKIFFIFFIISMALPLLAKTPYDDERIFTRATITKIERHRIAGDDYYPLYETRIHVTILDGNLKGQSKIATFRGEHDLPKDMFYKTGDVVFIGISKSGEENTPEYISLYDIDNTSMIIFLALLLVVSVLVIGKTKGVLSLIALIITILLLFFVLIPLTLKGYPPLPVAIVIAIISTAITLPVIAGFQKKTLAAILGASCGIIIAAILAFIVGNMMHLSGFVTNEMLTVFYVADVTIDVRGLALASIIIAALGAVMDVCISIASATAEIYNANPDLTHKQAFRSVLNIGTDILGSMVNTLILAYVGSSLSLILLISMRIQPGMPLWMIFNYNPILSEIVKSIIGSIGMFICIPITAYISVHLYGPKRIT